MNEKWRYHRDFFIFDQEDPGFGSTKEPSGYLKLEIKDGKGRVDVHVQNLREDPGRIIYKVYLVRLDGKGALPLYVGSIFPQRGRGELKWDFNPANIGAGSYPADSFNCAVVLAEYKDRDNSRIVCPLASFKGKPNKWRESLRDALYPKKAAERPIEKQESVKIFKKVEFEEMESAQDEAEEILQRQDVFSKYPLNLESKYIPSREDIQAGSESEEQIKPEVEEKMAPVAEGIIEADEEGQTGIREDEQTVADEEGQTEIREAGQTAADEEGQTEIREDEQTAADEEDQAGIREEGKIVTDEEDQTGVREDGQTITGEKHQANLEEEHKTKVDVTEHKRYESELHNALERDQKEPEITEKKVKDDEYRVTGTVKAEYKCPLNKPCPIPMQGMGSSACESCISGNMEKTMARDENTVNLDKLSESFGRYFEAYSPFGNRKSNYKWWKVNSPVYLNNILFQHNVKTPLLFNPAVMMSHFKYRHLIIGIYSDRVRKKEYIVAGIPGVYSIDDRPFGDLCRWVQLEGYRPRYGAFGYWLVYIDPKNGRLLKVN